MARPCRFALGAGREIFWTGKKSFRYGRRRRRGGSSLVSILPSPRRSSRLNGSRLRALRAAPNTSRGVGTGKVHLRRLACPTHGTAVQEDSSASL